MSFLYFQLVLSSMVSVVEPLLLGPSAKLTSVESDLVVLTLRRFDESVAPTLTPECGEMKLLINTVKSRQRIATSNSSLAAATIAQVTLSISHLCK